MRLAEARLIAETSRSALAKASGVASNRIGDIENGRRLPTIAMVRKLAWALAVNPEQIEELNAALVKQERPGDPCTCGCGGAKVPSTDPKVRSLRISCPCPTCGAGRILRQGRWQQHSRPCRKCSGSATGALREKSRIEVTCPKCGRIRQYTEGQMQARLRDNNTSALMDWDTRTCVLLCSGCGSKNRMTERHNKLRKRFGRKYQVEWGKRISANNTSESRAKSVQAMSAALNSRPRTEEHKRNQGKARVTPRPAGIFGICRVCGQVANNKNRSKMAQFHQPCLDTWRSEYMNSFDSRPYPPRPEGRLLSQAELADSYEMCVRHLLRGERLGDSEIEGGSHLCAKFGLTRRSIRNRIRSFLERLPTDGRGSKRLAGWTAHLLRAARELGYNV